MPKEANREEIINLKDHRPEIKDVEPARPQNIFFKILWLALKSNHLRFSLWILHNVDAIQLSAHIPHLLTFDKEIFSLLCCICHT